MDVLDYSPLPLRWRPGHEDLWANNSAKTQGKIINLRDDGAHGVQPDETEEELKSTLEGLSTQPPQNHRIILLENLTPRIYKSIQDQFDLDEEFLNDHILNQQPSKLPWRLKRKDKRLFGRMDLHLAHENPQLLREKFEPRGWQTARERQGDVESASRNSHGVRGYTSWQQLKNRFKSGNRVVSWFLRYQNFIHAGRGFSIPRQLTQGPFIPDEALIENLRQGYATSWPRFWCSKSSISTYRMAKCVDYATGT